MEEDSGGGDSGGRGEGGGGDGGGGTAKGLAAVGSAVTDIAGKASAQVTKWSASAASMLYLLLYFNSLIRIHDYYSFDFVISDFSRSISISQFIYSNYDLDLFVKNSEDLRVANTWLR